MIMLCTEMTGEVPFRKVHIHGLVRDADKQKISKMKGNVIDPLVVNEKFGTDAVRFGLLIAAAPGADPALSDEIMERGRNFANKIWNASRLLFSKSRDGAGVPQTLADRWIASRLNGCAEAMNRAFENHRYHEAADAIWTFFWDEFCDWYLELKKLDNDWSYAYIGYERALRLLHPLMPFVTEELWHRLGNPADQSIGLAAYPQFDRTEDDASAQNTIDVIKRVVTEIRSTRAPAKSTANVSAPPSAYIAIDQNRAIIERLSNATLALSRGEFAVKMDVPVDREKLAKDNLQLEKVIANSRRQLENPDIVGKMPEKVVATLRAKLAEYEAQLKKNRDALGE
jgi:valyl-tRNA synthetase